MGAFNRRLAPKELFGLPLLAVAGLVVALAFGLLALLLSVVFLKLLALLLALAGLLIAVFGFWLGADLPLRAVLWAAFQERHRVTSGTWWDA